MKSSKNVESSWLIGFRALNFSREGIPQNVVMHLQMDSFRDMWLVLVEVVSESWQGSWRIKQKNQWLVMLVLLWFIFVLCPNIIQYNVSFSSVLIGQVYLICILCQTKILLFLYVADLSWKHGRHCHICKISTTHWSNTDDIGLWQQSVTSACKYYWINLK